VWTSSAACAEIYASQLGVARELITPTGYARTDGLVNGAYDPAELRRRYGIDSSFDKIVLVAPTWQQDDKGRSIIPFGVSEAEFFEALDAVARTANALVIFRAHLNVEGADALPSLTHVRKMPYARYPVVEEFIAMSDLLVTDWSSMAFDFLPLRRPVVFLDVKPPFKDGFTIGPEHRYGDIVDGLDELCASVVRNLEDPAAFEREHAAQLDATREVVYGDTLDGQVAARQLARLDAYRR
jgi:CDP-glycerol glycerophosphotransferase